MNNSPSKRQIKSIVQKSISERTKEIILTEWDYIIQNNIEVEQSKV